MNESNQESQIHPNYKKAADLIYLSGALGIGNVIWMYDTLDNALKIFTALISVGFVFGIGYLISKGTEWIKFLLAVILFLGIVGIPFVIQDLENNTVVGIINILQAVLQIWALILLFKIPKKEKSID